MVHQRVWSAARMGDGYLCVTCLEQRLGRTLCARDFTAYPVNLPSPWDTPRIAARKQARSSLRTRSPAKGASVSV